MDFLMGIKDGVSSFARQHRDSVTPVLTQTAFLDKGMLTPEEFVRAGDHLVSCYPSWEWCEGEPGKMRTYLPPKKQFLLSRGVPSYRRCAQMSRSVELGSGIPGDEDWEAPTLTNPAEYDSDEEVLVDATDALDIEDMKAPGITQEEAKDPPLPPPVSLAPSIARSVGGAATSVDAYDDMEDDSLALDDSTVKPATGFSSDEGESGTKTSGIMRARRYDISISYDNFYRVPHVWLFGYDESGSPLNPESVFQVFQ